MSPTDRRPPAHVQVAMLKDADRFEQLATDLRRIANGEGPLPSELLAAPVLEGWQFRQHRAIHLTGICTGHPLLPDGRVFTSDLKLLAPDKTWARTTSRFYVLGEPAEHPISAEGHGHD